MALARPLCALLRRTDFPMDAIALHDRQTRLARLPIHDLAQRCAPARGPAGASPRGSARARSRRSQAIPGDPQRHAAQVQPDLPGSGLGRGAAVRGRRGGRRGQDPDAARARPRAGGRSAQPRRWRAMAATGKPTRDKGGEAPVCSAVPRLDAGCLLLGADAQRRFDALPRGDGAPRRQAPHDAAAEGPERAGLVRHRAPSPRTATRPRTSSSRRLETPPRPARGPGRT